MRDEQEQSTEAVDQPSQESTQMAEDQDQVTSSDEEASEDTPLEVDLGGKKVSIEQINEWEKGYMRNQDYTKKTQELAEAKRQIARTLGEEPAKKEQELDPTVQAALETLKQAGVATKDDLLAMKAQEEDEKELRGLLRKNPELKAHEKAIRAIGYSDNRAWVDIVKDYGFTTGDKLAKAKASKPLVGSKAVPVDEKASKLPPAGTPEWEVWKKANLGRDVYR